MIVFFSSFILAIYRATDDTEHQYIRNNSSRKKYYISVYLVLVWRTYVANVVHKP